MTSVEDKIIVFLIALCAVLVGIVCVVNGLAYRKGYIEAFIDMKNGNKPEYILKVQNNGEVYWTSNERKEGL